MAGHSKFKNIQHRKGAQDKKRAKVFNKLGREITVAAKLGGPDPDMNPRLRLAVSAARAGNMPNDRIKRAIEVALPGSGDDTVYEEIRYEGYAPGGVAVIVEALTDNRNRTVAEVRMLFSKAGGTLGETNTVAFMFDRVGEIILPQSAGGFDDVFEASLEAGAENIEDEGDYYEIHCAVEDFSVMQDALEKKYGEFEKSGLIWRPQTLTPVDGETAEKIIRLIDALEESDDVQAVFTNMDLSDEDAEKLLAAG